MSHEKIRILFVCNSKSVISGAELSLFALITQLDKIQYTPFLILSESLEFPAIAGLETKRIRMIDFRRTTNPLMLLIYLWHVLLTGIKIARFIRLQKIDIVHSNSNKAHMYGGIAAWMVGVPAIWHLRDHLKSAWTKYLLARLSCKVICVSKYMSDCHKGFENKKKIIYNGFTPPSLDQLDNKLKLKLKLAHNKVLVAQIGQVIPWKRPDHFIKVAILVLQKTKNVHFLVIGSTQEQGYPYYLKSLEESIKNNKIQKHISFLGWRNDIDKIFRQIDILVHSAIHEPFGRVVVEAMSYAKPVIAVRSGGQKELVADLLTGYLVEPNDPQAMSEKIIELSSDKIKQRQMGQAGHCRWKKYFHETKYVGSVQNTYSSVLNMKQGCKS